MQQEDGARRFCEVCTKQVHDLSAMTERDARQVLAEESAKGRVCVRYKADGAGNIRFMPEPSRTVAAPMPSAWRTMVAAASLGLMMLTGCADKQPELVESERCVYEIGPWSFTAQRGQGSCPDPEPESLPEHELLGKIAIEPEPMMGEPAIEEPDPPAPVEVKGEIEPIEQVEALGEIEMMGDIAVELPEEPKQAQPCDGEVKPEPPPHLM